MGYNQLRLGEAGVKSSLGLIDIDCQQVFGAPAKKRRETLAQEMLQRFAYPGRRIEMFCHLFKENENDNHSHSMLKLRSGISSP
ncbi:MAG: hypothetical protein HC824_14360 [Synechococcales cyanobacterium RM1_1_8]|nr:hypothetical protein [Synechococcales cyanobacterium RM1_1_8]